MADVITRFKVETDQFDRKINNAKRSLDQFGLKGSEAGRNIESMTRMLNINVASLSKLSVALAAAGAAIKVMHDAFKQNEQAQDEWGRITESSKGVYDGFLNALNTGDLSGFLHNINSIVSAARQAYDALDELGTFNAFNQIQTEMARTNFTEAMAAYREGSGSKADVEAAANTMKNELLARQQREQDAYVAAINALAAKRGVDKEMLQQALGGTYGSYEDLKNLPMSGREGRFSAGGAFGGSVYYEVEVAANEQERLGEMLRNLTDEELANIQALGAQAQRTGTEVAQVDKQVARLKIEKPAGAGRGSKTEKVYAEGSIGAAEQELAKLNEAWKNAADDPSRAQIKTQIDQLTASIKHMKGETQKVQQSAVLTGPSGYSEENIRAMQEELRKQMASMQLGDDDYMAAMAQSIDLTTFTNIVNEAIKNGVQIDPATLESIFEQMFNGENIPDEVWTALADTINEHLAELDIKPIEVDVKTGTVSTQKDAEQLAVLGENAQKAWAGATSAIGSVGSALQSLDDPGAKVAGIIATAIANVAAGLGQMLSEPGATSEAWGWVALAASGAATMVSTIAAIKSATSGYWQGGIVGSLNGSLNSPSGDNIVARLNAGEGVLTRTGIETAQRMSHGGGMANLHFEKVITGSDIRLILTNDNRARGGSRGAYAIR